MQKDVVYIDVDDDITAIIGKLKASKHKIVALIPPKRIGVLQSAVNLRLLNRAAEQSDKRLVIITGNEQLAMLAAGAKIPIAKTLQSKPELAEIDALEIDDGEEVIDGSKLAVGEHAKQGKTKTPSTDALVDEIDAENKAAVGSAAVAVTEAKTKPKGAKVPNFDIFRKKFFLIVLGVLLLAGFLVWAIIFAPRATITLQAKTSDVAVNQQVNIKPGVETSAKNATIAAVVKQGKKDISVPITPTGKKEVGDKATGIVRMSTGAIDLLGKTVPAGTVLTTDTGMKYSTTEAVTFSLANYAGANAGIRAVESGAKYNGAGGSMTGAPSGVNVRITTTTSGGTDKTVAVATRSDIDKAMEEANKGIDKEAMKQELLKQFTKEYLAIPESFTVAVDTLQPNVAVDQEAPATGAKVAGAATSYLYGVDKQQLDTYLKAVIEQQIDDKEHQRLYKTGSDTVKFTNIESSKDGVRTNISTNGKTGPKITEDRIKELVKGKTYGQIKSSLESFQGINGVDVKLSPFWVTTAPTDTKKITVEFKVHE